MPWQQVPVQLGNHYPSRGRGNPLGGSDFDYVHGSIPAWAGEPHAIKDIA